LLTIKLTILQVDAYLDSTDGMQTELLQFWESKSLQCTKLGQVARGLLGIPAASIRHLKGHFLQPDGQWMSDEPSWVLTASMDFYFYFYTNCC